MTRRKHFVTWLPTHINCNSTTAVAKFERIGDEVLQNLCQPCWVGQHPLRHGSFNGDGEGDLSLLCDDGVENIQVTNEITNGKWLQIEIHSARLNATQIENGRGDGMHVRHTCLQNIHGLGLSIVQRTLLQQ